MNVNLRLLKLMLSLCDGVGVVVVVGWGLHSHFRVQPNYSIEVVFALYSRWGCDNITNMLRML